MMEMLGKVIVSLFAAAIIIVGVAIITLAIVQWVFNNPGFPLFFAINAALIGLIVVLAHFFGTNNWPPS